MLLTLDKNKRVKAIDFDCEGEKKTAFSMGITIINKSVLKTLVDEAYEDGLISFNCDVIGEKYKSLKVYGFEHSEYVTFMNGTDSYYKASMDLLNPEIRKQLFNKERPIFTKTRDDMPTRYGTKSDVSNCLIADGCVIDGTVKNSILFRGVTVEKGAVVENCILTQETKVGKDANLNNVISDKNAVIGEGMVLKGTDRKHFFIKKNQIV